MAERVGNPSGLIVNLLPRHSLHSHCLKKPVQSAQPIANRAVRQSPASEVLDKGHNNLAGHIAWICDDAYLLELIQRELAALVRFPCAGRGNLIEPLCRSLSERELPSSGLQLHRLFWGECRKAQFPVFIDLRDKSLIGVCPNVLPSTLSVQAIPQMELRFGVSYW